MADLKLIANVGFLAGLNGNGMVYAAKTPGGTHFLAVYFDNEDIEEWKYIPAQSLLNYVAANQAGYAHDLDLSKFTSLEKPEFVTVGDKSGGLYTLNAVINGEGVEIKWNGESAYTVKGEGITNEDISAIRKASGSSVIGTGSTTTTDSGTGTLGGLIPSAAEFNRLFSDPVGFIRTNIMFVVAVLAVVYYVRRKKKKPLWVI